jgi:hypothetical protein
VSEPEGRGAAWTDEEGAPATSEEGRRCLKSAPQANLGYCLSDGEGYRGGWGWLNRIMFPDGSRNAQSMIP